MHTIDMHTWSRRRHFRLFNGFDYPHINLCAPVDVSRLANWSRQEGEPFTVGVMYALARTANRMPPFRWRIRGETVVEHDRVHPSSTVMADGDLFSFCTIPYVHDFRRFSTRAQGCIARRRAQPTLEDEEGQDELLYMTAIPWVSFTAISHPIHMTPVDSIPRMAWGRMTREGDGMRMPLSIQVHHALMDGIHLGRFFERVQQCLDDVPW